MYKLFRCNSVNNDVMINDFMDYLLTFFSITLPNSFRENPVEWIYTYPSVEGIPTLVNGDISPFSGDGSGPINFPDLVSMDFRYIYIKLKTYKRPLFFFVSNKYTRRNLDPSKYTLKKIHSESGVKYSVFVSLGLYSFVNNDSITYYPQGLRICKERPLLENSSFGYTDYESCSINVFPFCKIPLDKYTENDKWLYFCYHKDTFVILCNYRNTESNYHSHVLFYITPKRNICLEGHSLYIDFLTSPFYYLYNADYMSGYLIGFAYSDRFPCAINVTLDANIVNSIVSTSELNGTAGSSESIYSCSSYKAQPLTANPEKRFIFDKSSGRAKTFKAVNDPVLFLSTDRLGSTSFGRSSSLYSPTKLPTVYPTLLQANKYGITPGINIINWGSNTLNNHFNLYSAVVYARREPMVLNNVSVFCKVPLLYYCETDFLSDDSIIEYNTFNSKFLICRNNNVKDFAILVEDKRC